MLELYVFYFYYYTNCPARLTDMMVIANLYLLDTNPDNYTDYMVLLFFIYYYFVRITIM